MCRIYRHEDSPNIDNVIALKINNNSISVDDGTTVAVAILAAGVSQFRHSVSGESRGPLCGMGVCFECRVTIDRVAHQRSCSIIAQDGMEVVTDE